MDKDLGFNIQRNESVNAVDNRPNSVIGSKATIRGMLAGNGRTLNKHLLRDHETKKTLNSEVLNWR